MSAAEMHAMQARDLIQGLINHQSKQQADAFERASQGLFGETPSAWFRGVASRAATAAAERGLPTRRLEAWSYTGLERVFKAPVSAPMAPLPAESLRIGTVVRKTPGASADLVFYNGFFVPELSDLPAAPGCLVSAFSAPSVGIGELKAALAPFAESYTSERFAAGPWFDALNAALAHDALLISVAPNTRLAGPLVITFVSSNAQTDGGRVLAAARVLARFGALSEGAILERHVTLGGGECLTVPAVDVRVEAGARVCYSRVQTESEVSSHFSSLSATVARDGVFSSFDASLGGRLSRHELSVRLTGEGAEAAVNGLYLTGGSQHHDHRTSIEHVVGHTTSSQLYKGILAGEARAVFNGRIHITRRAQKSSAAQLCQTLSLSKKAEIDAKPELVIEADDVKASHGATVGQLDPEQLFYFQTRAIGAAAAARALARGFAQDVAFRVPDVPSQDLVARDLDDKLERLIRSSANQLEPAVRA